MDANPLLSPQDEVVQARPDIEARTEQMVSKGRWMPPGYQVLFPAYTSYVDDLHPRRRNLATFPYCRLYPQQNQCTPVLLYSRFRRRQLLNRSRGRMEALSIILRIPNVSSVFRLLRSPRALFIYISALCVFHNHSLRTIVFS
jgi:hypothetical protein